MTGMQIIERAKEQLTQLTGLKTDTVSALSKDEKGWHVLVEMVEMVRVPNSRDLLATYETLLDDKGELINYKRTRRYLREQLMEQEE
jgi:hypothetical protein